MNFLRCAGSVLLAVGLLACGGGGGPDTIVKVPTLSLTLVDGTESVVSDRSLSTTDSRYLKVALRTKSGAPAAYVPVSVSLGAATAVMLPADGQKLTDANGVALIKISPADPSQGFVIQVTAAASVESTSLSSPLALQFRGGGAVVTGSPTIDMSLVDASGVTINSKALSQTVARYLKVVLKTKVGAAAPYTRITVALDAPDAVLVPTSGIGFTDDMGVMLMRVSPASVSAAGGVVATASASVENVALSKALDLAITSGSVGLSDFQVSPASVQQGQSLTVSVAVQVNGVTASSNSVPVTFSSPCGTAAPSPALVDSSGRASAVLQTMSTGACAVTAGTTGNVSLTGSFTVTTPPTTGLVFVSATPTLIYQSGSVGVNQSTVKFKVVNSNNDPVAGSQVSAGLTNTNDGITFCGAPTTVTSGADGTVSFSVCGGTVPATVQVRASLVSTPAIATVSNILTVQTGLPTQRFFGLSVTQPNFHAGGYFTAKFNGNSTTITAYAADRLGNPVPQGTTIVFVSSGGLISSDTGSSSCVVSGTTGRCSVTLYGQEYRPLGSASTLGTSPTGAGGDPRPGRVTVLAYTDGEEHFFDANNNNRWDSTESFEDLGRLYLDRDNNKVFQAAYINVQTQSLESDTALSMPAGSVDAKACSTTDIAANPGLSVEGTCNGTWDGFTKVRRSLVVVFSGDAIGEPAAYSITIPVTKRTRMVPASASDVTLLKLADLDKNQGVCVLINPTACSVTVQLADLDGNPLPADATIAAKVILATDTSTCTATLADTTIGNALEPTQHTAVLKTCGTGDGVEFVVTAPNGKASSYSVVVIP